MTKGTPLAALAKFTLCILLVAAFGVNCSRSPDSAKSSAQISTTQTADLASLIRDANAGSTNAQLQLGIRYLGGTNVQPNYPEAVKWLEQAARSGNAQAEFLL